MVVLLEAMREREREMELERRRREFWLRKREGKEEGRGFIGGGGGRDFVF